MEDKKPSEILGFYFVIFQATLTSNVKCWIDGSDYYDYVPRDEFLGYFNQAKYKYDLLLTAMNCLDTTSIYLWDVDNANIKRLSTSFEYSNINKEIIDIKNNYTKNSYSTNNEIDEWKKQVDL